MENIRIYAPGDILLLDVPVTAKSTHEQELMKTDHIHLEWSDSECVNLPLGAYVRVDNIVYTLAKPYYPDSRNMGKYDYSVDFEHELMLLQRVPFLLYREDGVECDWNYTGLFQDLKNALKQAIFKAVGVYYDIRIDESANRAISLSFSNVDIFSALNSIAEDLECEWWYEDVIAGVKSSAIIYFGTKCVHEHGEDSVLELTAGQEVGYPSSNNKGEFFNRFFVFGSTRNIPQDYEGANANTIVNKRLTLDPSIHPEGYMDLPAFDINGNIHETTGTDPNGRPFWKEDGSLGYYRVDQSVTDGVRTFTKVLQLDDIYPRADLHVAHVAKCVKFVRDQNGEKVELTPGVFSTFSVFYVQFADVTGKVFDINPTTYQTKTNPDGHVLPNTTPGIHFNSGALTGREFEVFKYHEVAPTIKNETDGESVSFAEFGRGDINAGIFEIQYKEDNTIIIPNDGIEPIVSDKAVVFNIRMPEAYVTKGYKDLDQAALVQIYEATKDGNEYTVQGNSVYFAENEPGITIGRHVYFYTQGRKIDTRVVKLTRNLDRRFEIELSLGKSVTRGAIQTILANIESTQQSVVTTRLESRQAVKEAQKRAYDAQRELHDMIFDADDYFKDGNIRPETIETLMLTVGAVSTNLELTGVTFCANNDGTSTENPNAVNIIQGASAKLRHYGLSDSVVKEWTLTKPATAYTKDEEGKAFVSSTPYYLYARCSTSGTSGSFVFSTNKYKYNQFVDTNHVYYFLIGVLSSVLTGYRVLNMTYGNTAITGDQMRTGSIRSNNGDVVIDLNKGTIKSNKGITFIPRGEAETVTIEDYQARIKDLYEYLADAVKLASAYGTTTIDGGVVLTSAMVLAHPVTKAVMAGLNGVLSDAKDVAAWFGGNMWDVENLKSGENASDAATSLFRRDGTGYLAGGNIRWDERGFIYADPTSFLVGTGADGQAVQLALYFVKLKEDQTIEGLKRFVSGIGVGNGSGLIEWDATRNMFRFNAGIYSTSDIVAYGVGDSDIQTVIDVVEAYLSEHGGGGGGLSSVVITSSGSGNVVSGMSKTLSDDGKTLTLTLTKGISAYVKPSTGIPLADLASSVQTALGKADTALQEHQSLQGYATEQWVNNKGYLTSHQDISGKLDKSSWNVGRTTSQQTDWNGFTTNGNYFVHNAAVTNKPSNVDWYGQLLVLRGDTTDTITQLYFPYNGGNPVVRSGNPLKSGGNWNAWKTLAYTSDITSAVGNLAVTDTAVANQFVTAVSETDGKISVSRASLTATNIAQAGKLSNATSGKADTAGLSDKLVRHDYSSGSSWALAWWGNDNTVYATPGVTITPNTKTITATTFAGNATTATTLATPRTIWGQSFDGTTDVNGYVIINNDYGIEGKDAGGTARTLLTFNSSNQVNLGYGTAGAGYDTYINGNNTIFRQGTGHLEIMRITSGGNVGIGTTAPLYKLHVAGGAVYSDTAIRVPNNKPFASQLANGTDINLLSINANNKVNVGNSSYPTDVNGSTITLYNSATEKVTVTGGRLMATGTIDAVGGISINKGTYGARASFNYANNTGRWDIAVDGDSDAMRWVTTNAAGNDWEGGNRMKLDTSGNLTAGGNITASGNVKIKSGGYLHSAYQSDAPIVKDHGNGNVTINAVGTSSAAGELFLGYYNTKKLNFYAGTTRSNSVAETQIGAWDISGMTINASSANGLVIKRTAATSGAFVNYYNNNQSSNAWRVGMNSLNSFVWAYSTNGLSSDTGKLTLDTSGNLVATGDVTAYSDKRLKSDIKDLEYRGSLEPKTYIKDGKKSIGFIAQEVREKYPELVIGEESENSYLSLNYGGITAVLAAENKELRNEVTELKNEVEELKKLINKLIEEK